MTTTTTPPARPRAAAEDRVAQERATRTSTAPNPAGQPNRAPLVEDLAAKLGFSKAGADARFAKIMFYGEQGSGKTTTSIACAIYLARAEQRRSIWMIDSEGGADYVERLCAKFGLALYKRQTRSFQDLVDMTTALHDSGEVLVIDSVTHFWNDVVTAATNAKKYKTLELKDWGGIFEEWRRFTQPYVRSRYHGLVASRMGWDYANTVNPETKKLEFYKSGTKAKVGEQFGHDPSMLVLMEQVDNAQAREAFRQAQTRQDRAVAAQSMLDNRSLDFVANIEKDRTGLLMARQFLFSPSGDDVKDVEAVWAAFRPVLDWHLKQGGGPTFHEAKSTTERFPSAEDDRAYWDRRKRKELLLGEIKATFERWFPAATSPKEKQARILVAESVFGVRSCEAVEQLELDLLEDAIGPQPSGSSKLEAGCVAKRKELDQVAVKAEKETA